MDKITGTPYTAAQIKAAASLVDGVMDKLFEHHGDDPAISIILGRILLCTAAELAASSLDKPEDVYQILHTLVDEAIRQAEAHKREQLGVH